MIASGQLKIILTTIRALQQGQRGLPITQDMQRWVYHYGLILQSVQKDTGVKTWRHRFAPVS